MGPGLLISFLLGPALTPQSSGFSEFVNRDLTQLKQADRLKLDSLCKRFLPMKERNGREMEFDFGGPSPRWIKPYPYGSIRWLFLWIAPLFSIPGVSYARAYSFDENWKLVRQYDFPTGYRLNFASERLEVDRWFPQPVLTIRVTSVGPFIVREGQPARPLFHPETGIRQRYTFDETGAHLVRLEEGNGELMTPGYGNGISFMGPNTANRGLKAWTADLNSADPSRQLECLIWLSGRHLNSKDWRQNGYARETIKDSMTYEALRVDKAVLSRIKALEASRNPWLAKQAAHTLKSLSQPLEEVTDPPGS